jgi:phosphoadenosine phosphosulfate reductase
MNLQKIQSVAESTQSELLAAFADGRRTALQFSGGKDSLACLYLLRPFILRGMPVYWLHTGDTIPETVAVVEQVRSWIPDFREVRSDVMSWRAIHGMPSDVTTAQTSWIGRQYGMSHTSLVGRMDCCAANLMMPMHQRMIADGIEVVVRGTKVADTGVVPAHGKTDCYDVVLPLLHWSHAEVFAYLDSVDAPRNPVYENFRSISAPECLNCTAWWDDGKGAYLKQRHPGKIEQYRVSLQTIRAELARRMQELDSELEECGS